MNIAPCNAVWFLHPFHYKLDAHNHLVLFNEETKEWDLSSYNSVTSFIKEGVVVLGKCDIRKDAIQLLISRFGITSKQANKMMDADVINVIRVVGSDNVVS
jgi:hypothetical protein